MSHPELVDTVSLICYSQQEQTVLLGREGSSEIWTPCKKVLLGSTLQLENPFRVYKIWIPEHVPPYVYHVVYAYETTSAIKTNVKVKGGRLQWYEVSELHRLNRHRLLQNPEVLGWIKHLSYDVQANLKELLDIPGLVVGDTVIEFSEIQIRHLIEKNHALWTATQWNTRDVFHLYRQFIVKAFPALLFSQEIFNLFLLEGLGWLPTECRLLFRSADETGRGAVSFRELALLIAAMQPDTQHTGNMGELRNRYIFRYPSSLRCAERGVCHKLTTSLGSCQLTLSITIFRADYYDANGDGQMENAEFKDMIAAIRLAKDLPLDVLSVSHAADECLRKMGLQPGGAVSLSQFKHGVADKRLRGLSLLLRSPRSLTSPQDTREHASTIASLACVQKLAQKYQRQTLSKLVDQALMPGSGPREPRVRPIEYVIATGSVRLHRGAWPQLDDLNTFTEETVSPSTLLLRSLAEPLDARALPAQALAAVRSFASDRAPQGGSKEAFTWRDEAEREEFGALVLQLALLVKQLLIDEPRLLRASAPLYVIGDLHGNLSALLSLEAMLWSNGAALSPARLLFLGDYVDRGPHGLELVAYLLASKLQRPAAIHLLRGNHEVRDIQQAFTFHTECLTKYGETTGQDIWKAVNDVFDVMPLAAVVDDKVFCCHGGIPPPWLCPLISAIDTIPVPLPNPAVESALAWELMWNDPIKKSKITPRLAVELAVNDGFAANLRRGTGHVFAQAAIDQFLYVNSLSHVVRAHELQTNGFMLQLRGQLVSVFSSYHYCGGNNDACVLLIDGGRLRLVRIRE